MQYQGEFAICFSLFAALNPLLMVTVIITASISFLASNYLNGWGYRHRDEEAEYSRRMNYLSEKSRDYTLAKDVRIFGMKDWIEDVYKSTFQLFRDFSRHKEKVYLYGDITNIIFTLIRNGIVYLYLIHAVIQGKCSTAQFLLYFNAVGVFANGIGGILSGFITLARQSLDISAIREFLEYPESFLFDEGIPLAPDFNNNYQIQLKNVSFRYGQSQADILSHIDLTIQPGEKLAIVGLNGAGKTTLIKLICGWEAQKIALARALYKEEALLLILDEPTAALDPVAEFEIYSKMNEMMEGRTAIFISHRLSSCRFCQNICVFHEGELVQRGSHEELVADKSGKYYELWNAQAQYYTGHESKTVSLSVR